MNQIDWRNTTAWSDWWIDTSPCKWYCLCRCSTDIVWIQRCGTSLNPCRSDILWATPNYVAMNCLWSASWSLLNRCYYSNISNTCICFIFVADLKDFVTVHHPSRAASARPNSFCWQSMWSEHFLMVREEVFFELVIPKVELCDRHGQYHPQWFRYLRRSLTFFQVLSLNGRRLRRSVSIKIYLIFSHTSSTINYTSTASRRDWAAL